MTDIAQRPLYVGTPPGKTATLLVFVALACSACAELAPALRSLARSDRHELHTVIVSLDGDEEANRAYARARRLDHLGYLVDPNLGVRVGVTATPYAMLLDSQNDVRAKGIVNNLEQLESLLGALRPEAAMA
jgi:methylamine dehydrogenase accessory protein MauD